MLSDCADDIDVCMCMYIYLCARTRECVSLYIFLKDRLSGNHHFSSSLILIQFNQIGIINSSRTSVMLWVASQQDMTRSRLQAMMKHRSACHLELLTHFKSEETECR